MHHLDLQRYPRMFLGGTHTPLEYLPRLTKLLGGPSLFIKREDCSRLATGGNKTRKLEFLLGDAQRQGADTIVTSGATQSNHARQTAAAAAKMGFQCTVVLEARVPSMDPQYSASGNALLDKVLGASIVSVPSGADMPAFVADVAQRLRDAGRSPYVIPVGGSNVIGTLGFVECAVEILAQTAELQVPADHLVVASGSAGTHAGLIVGLDALGSSCTVSGISVGAPSSVQAEKVGHLAAAVCRELELPAGNIPARVWVDDEFIGPGYGLPTPAVREAIDLVARHEGILLDPVYTGKSMAALIYYVRSGRYAKHENVIFVHTGGSAALFGYELFLGQPQ